MGFLSNMLSAAVKTAATPLAAVIDIATLGQAEATKGLVEDIIDDLDDAFNGR